jgi:hypothetical protein
MRKMASPWSSLTSMLPSCNTSKHTGRPQLCWPLQPAFGEGLVAEHFLAFGVELGQRDAVAAFLGAVPGAVLGDENLVAVGGRNFWPE